MEAVADFDLHAWFATDELDRCPACGEVARIRLPATGSLLCLACGGVTAAAEAPSDDPARPGTTQ
jgi:rRNA maturation protein Nop10